MDGLISKGGLKTKGGLKSGILRYLHLRYSSILIIVVEWPIVKCIVLCKPPFKAAFPELDPPG